MVSSARTPLLLDTGPLLTYLSLKFLDEIEAQQQYRDEVLADVRGRAFLQVEQERLALAFVRRTLLTTAHVATEVFRLRNQSKLGERKEQFRRFSLNFLMQNVSEVQSLLSEVNGDDFRPILYRHGLTDAALIVAADKTRSLLLTDDSRLRNEFGAGTRFEIQLLRDFLNQGG
jgi:hypothetical protein